jgi:hypothetical protein
MQVQIPASPVDFTMTGADMRVSHKTRTIIEAKAVDNAWFLAVQR